MPRIHDDEVDTSEPVVRALLRAQTPAWADRPLVPVGETGTDHAVRRLGDDLLVRVPRTDRAADSLREEVGHLRRVDGRLPVAVPGLVHLGRPGASYRFAWAVLRWLDGEDAWAARDVLDEPHRADRLARDLAGVVTALRSLPTDGVRRRGHGRRGGPIEGVLERIDLWLGGAEGPLPPTVDAAAVREVVAASTKVTDAAPYDDARQPPVLSHGDLIPGNLLVRDGRLTAVIDWGYLSAADPALDLVPAWAVVTPAARPVFRDLVGADDPTWERARLTALEQALGAIAYYTPRRHPLADVMRRTLSRILEDR